MSRFADQTSLHGCWYPITAGLSPDGTSTDSTGAGAPELQLTDVEDGNVSSDDLASNAEDVWSPDIEQSFQEALAIYPPCGRKKIILSDEGKMFGRNELIARYIKLRTGKLRSRKQVSSHIQVMARRKAKEIQAQLKDQASKELALQTLSTMSSTQIVSAAAAAAAAVNGTAQVGRGLPLQSVPRSLFYQEVNFTGVSMNSSFQPTTTPSRIQCQQSSSSSFGCGLKQNYFNEQHEDGLKDCIGPAALHSEFSTARHIHRIAGPRLQLVEFSAFVEQYNPSETNSAVDVRQIADKFPDKRGGLKQLFDNGPESAFFLVKIWADITVNSQNEASNFYGISSIFESDKDMVIQCSTKICSFGKQVAEKVESDISGRLERGRYYYRLHRSPMCDYMINFILKLKKLPEKVMMNNVLENFTVFQVLTERDTRKTLLCIAYVFEVSNSDRGSQYHVYRLVKE